MTIFSTITVRALKSIAAIESEKKYSMDEKGCLVPYEGIAAFGETVHWLTVAVSRQYYGDSVTTIIPRIQKLSLDILTQISKANGEFDRSKGNWEQIQAKQTELKDFADLFKNAIEGLKRLQTTYGGITTEQGTLIQRELISRYEDIQRVQLSQLVNSATQTVAFQNQIASPANFGFSQLEIELLLKASSSCQPNEPTAIANTFVLLSTPVNGWFALNKTVELGRGQYSVTYPAIRLSDQKMFAFAVSQIRPGSAAKEADLKEVMSKVLGETQGIVRIYARIDDDNTHYSLMDLYDRGSLEQQNLSTWDDSLKLSCMRQLIEALNCLYKQEITHADIKPANILLRTTSDRIEFAFGDVGGTTFYDAPETAEIGTPLYMSPERLDAFCDPKVQPPVGSDVWALGCVFWKILTGENPSWMVNMLRNSIYILQAIETGKKEMKVRLPEPKANTPHHLVWEMLDPDPKTRIKPDALEKKIKLLVLERQMSQS